MGNVLVQTLSPIFDLAAADGFFTVEVPDVTPDSNYQIVRKYSTPSFFYLLTYYFTQSSVTLEILDRLSPSPSDCVAVLRLPNSHEFF